MLGPDARQPTERISMKRWTVVSMIAALAVLAVPACTRTIVREPSAGSATSQASSAQASPASIGSAVDASSEPIVGLVQRVRPAVVNVTTDTLEQSISGIGSGRGVGTGFIVRPDGIIVTNYHVVEGAQHITVITPDPNSQKYDARVIGGDQTADLAVLKIDADGLPTVPLGSSGDLQLGQRVVAIGYALALEGGPTVTTGIVSALGRSIQVNDPNCTVCANGVRSYSDVIQTDAAINPGNSGGPLLNLDGEVVGINSAGANSAENIGFAIAIDAAKPTIETAEANPAAPVAYLGVVTESVTNGMSYQFGLPVTQGAYVVDVTEKGPAQAGGITAGSVIVGFDGKDVPDSETLGQLIRSHHPGDHVDVQVVTSSGERRMITVTLGTNPLPQS
jgi:serine protease Do